MRGTTNAAVLKGDPNSPDLVASSVYTSVPVHYLSMACEELKWIVCEKPVYNVDTGKKELLNFLLMSYINDYNHGMGDVDIADQLRNNYRFDHWMRKRKWWWSIMFWEIGVILVNAYIVYMKVNLQAGKKKYELLSQHDFRMKVAMAWINPEIYWVGETNGPELSTWKKRKHREAHTKSYCDKLQMAVPQKLRAAKLDDDSLREGGRLCIRLD